MTEHTFDGEHRVDVAYGHDELSVIIDDHTRHLIQCVHSSCSHLDKLQHQATLQLTSRYFILHICE